MDRHIRIDLSSPRWMRRVLLLGVPIAAMAITSAAMGVPKVFVAGDTLNSADLNGNFADVEQQIADAAVTVTEWADYVPVVANNAGTPITIQAEPGGTSIGQWRRVGDSMEIRVTARFPTCPLMSTNLSWSLPAGVEVDYAKTAPYAIVGSALVVNGATGASLFPPTELGHPTNFPNRLFQPGATAGTTIHCSAIGADGAVRFHATFPVKGWGVGN